jgi:hypothetical protein
MKRYFFDHLPKTAGTAIGTLLRDALGENSVSPALIGDHRELISRYGNYDIITAHVSFKPGSSLDPRYFYFTILREPVERALSWLYFASRDVLETGETHNQIDAARQFLSSEGDYWSPVLESALRNPYTEHFLPLLCIASNIESIPAKIDLALSVLSRYNLVGIYDCLETFMDDLCAELRVPRRSLPIVNATTNRPKVHEISGRLRNRLEELTTTDSELFRAAKLLTAGRTRVNQASATKSIIDYSDKNFKIEAELGTENSLLWNRCVPEGTIEIVSSSVHCRDDPADEITSGSWATFEFHSHLRIDALALLVGIVIYEDSGRQIFGTNSDLLGREFKNIAKGKIVIRFNIRLNLAPGRYVAGIAVYGPISGQGQKLLGWWDRLVDFEIDSRPRDFVGITRLDSVVHVESTEKGQDSADVL